MLTDYEITKLSQRELDNYREMGPDLQLTYAIQWRKKQKSKSFMSIEIDTKSKMRVFGKFGFIVFFVLAVISTLMAMDSYSPELGWPLFWASLSSTCLVLWVIGTIELRLIEIREELRLR